MNTRPVHFLILLLAILATGGGIWVWKDRQMSRLMTENALLRRQLEQSRDLRETTARRPEPAPVAPSAAARASADREPDATSTIASEDPVEQLVDRVAQLSLPLEEENVASSEINAAVRHGETLITGGYRDDDGFYHFTTATPVPLSLDDGSTAVQLSFQEIAVSTENLLGTGLDMVASGARNTLQHGETWTTEDIAATLTELGETSGTTLGSMPQVVARPGQDVAVETSGDGSSRTIIANTELLPDGSGYALRLRVEHRDPPLEP